MTAIHFLLLSMLLRLAIQLMVIRAGPDILHIDAAGLVYTRDAKSGLPLMSPGHAPAERS
eukprot:scaffold605154_cov20-Prasinocladus_malaysianus.AAC.1